MGEGNSNRGRKGQGRGAKNWGLEAGPPACLPVVGNQREKRGKLDQGMETGRAEEYAAPPRRKQAGAPNIPTPEISPEMPEDQAKPADTGPKKENRIPIYRTGPTIETALRKPAEIEIKKTTKEKLEERLGGSSLGIDDKVRVKDALEEAGCSPTKKDLEKTVGLIGQKLKSLVGRITDKLIEKYSEEYVSEILDSGEFDAMVDESMEEIESEIRKEARDCYNIVLLEKKKRGKLTPAQGENGPKLADFTPKKDKRETPEPALAPEWKIDKSGENAEQKELRERIKEAIREAVKHHLDGIYSKIEEIKRGGGALINIDVDEKKLTGETGETGEIGRIKKTIADNLDAYAGIALQYFKGQHENPRLAQDIRTEARRMTAGIFESSREIRKIMPQGKFPREADSGEKPGPPPPVHEDIRKETGGKREKSIEEIFYREGRMKVIDKTIKAILAVHGKLLEDSKKWDGYKDLPDAERIQSVTIDTKANIMNIYSLLVSQKGFPPGEKFKRTFYDYAVSRISK